MSINIGNEAMTGCSRLRGNHLFEAFLKGLHRAAQMQVSSALSCTPEERADKTGYARACVDLWTACEAATREVRVQTLELGLMPAGEQAQMLPADPSGYHGGVYAMIQIAQALDVDDRLRRQLLVKAAAALGVVEEDAPAQPAPPGPPASTTPKAKPGKTPVQTLMTSANPMDEVLG